MPQFDYDSFDWSLHFKLDPSSPSGLAWNRESYSFNGNKKETWVGKPAGTLHTVKNGDNKAWSVYLIVDGKSKYLKVHRIILALHGVKLNGLVVDHINGISSDNRFENLRVTTQAVNSRNCKPQYNSPYGITGVSSQHDNKGNVYFVARVKVGDKTIQKNFPVKRLGVMEAFRHAVVARQQMIAELNEKGFQYTDRHSKVTPEALEFEYYKTARTEKLL